MKKKLSSFKLKYQIYILFGICILMIFAIYFLYYAKINKTIRNQIQEYADSSINQVEENINIICQSIKDVSFNVAYNQSVQTFLSKEKDKDRIQYIYPIAQIANNYILTNNNIIDIIIVDKEQDLHSFCSYMKYNEYYDIFHKSNFINPSFIIPKFVTIYNKENKVFYAYIEPIFDIEKYNEKYGYIIVLCSIANISDTLKKNIISDKVILSISDENNDKIIISNDEKIIGSEIEEINYHNDKKYIKNQKILEKIDWKITNFVSIDNVSEDLISFKNMILVIGLVIISIFVLIAYVIYKNITVPLTNLISCVNEIGHKNIKQRINISVHGELGEIVIHINEMLDKIENMTKKIFNTQQQLYEVELSKKQAELSALQSQINPHFLYNTLECIRSIATVYKSKEIIKIVTAMSKIFRYSIKGEEFVKVKDEIDIIHEYLNIMDIRFQNKFKFEINVDENILENKIPKMILQPIVENAVYHGLEPKLNTGILNIDGYVEKENLVFTIKDNGIGIDKSTLLNIQKLLKENIFFNKNIDNKRGIGILNIDKKIKLYVGKQYGVEINSEKEKGTIIKINLPINRYKALS